MGNGLFGQADVSRRDVLRLSGLAALGVTLGACGSSNSSSPGAAGATSSSTGSSAAATGGGSSAIAAGGNKTLVFAAEQDNTGTYQKLVNEFNQQNGTSVKYQSLPRTSNDVYQQYVSALAAGAATPDVLEIDVIWPAAFGAADWLADLGKYAGGSFINDFFPAAKEAGTVNGKLIAVQHYLDTGLLYYRTDLLKKYNLSVPKTMDDLVNAAQKIQQGEGGGNFNGFVFEGAQIEAVVDQWFEWLWGLGGDGAQNSKINVDSDASRKSLQFMHDLIYKDKVAPNSTSTQKPADSLVLMQNGNAAFMRNWVFAAAELADPKASKVSGKIGLAPLPGQSGAGHGCTGGWMLGINAHSKNPDLAWEFIKFLTGKQAQKEMALGAGLLPARPDVYDDPDIKQKAPMVAQMKDILSSSKSRPTLKDYTDQSGKIQPFWNGVLANTTSIDKAISEAKNALG